MNSPGNQAPDASHIAVSVRGGIVTLEGHVPAYGEKCIAERAAAHVLGVKAVADELEVKLLGRDERSDEDIAADCVHAVKAHYGVHAVSVKALISNGFVTLEGQVDWKYQKDAATSAVRHLTGVKGVVNNIDVKPRVSAGDEQKKITAALKRGAGIGHSPCGRGFRERQRDSPRLRAVVGSKGRSRTSGLVGAGRMASQESDHNHAVKQPENKRIMLRRR